MKNILKKIIHVCMMALNVIFFCFIFFLLYVSIFKPERIAFFIEWMDGIVAVLGNWNYLIAFLAAWVEALPIVGTMIPGQNILMLVGGFFGKVYLWEIISIAILGSILWDVLSYTLGRYIGERFINKYGSWFGVGKTEYAYMKAWIDKYGFWAIIGSKFHGMLRAFLPFIAGASKMQQKKFMLSNIVGSIIWTTGMVILGVLFVQYYEVVLQYIRYVVMGIIFLGIGYVLIFKRVAFKQYMADKEAEMNKE